MGKTSISANVSILLSQIGKKAILVDSDIAMANVGIVLGIESAPISLQNVLAGENAVSDAVYEGPAKIKYVPAGLSIDAAKKVDFSRFAPAIAELEKTADFIIIDCPPGMEPNTATVIKSAKEILIVVTPDPPSLADGLKVRQFASKHGIKTAGVVVNRFRGSPDEVRVSEIETLIGNKVLAVIPEDPEMRRSIERQSPLMLGNQGTPAGLALKKLAILISGEKIEAIPSKGGIFQRIIEALFGRKNQ